MYSKHRMGSVMPVSPRCASQSEIHLLANSVPRSSSGMKFAAKAVCLREAAQPAFKVYAENVVKNAKALAAALLERGFDLVTGGTDNHLMLADLRKKNITGKDLQIRLDEVHITVNKNAIPNDPQKPGVTSGVRIGTPACTTRGFTEEDMPVVADCIDKIATDYDANREAVLAAVAALVKKHPIYE